MFEIKLFDAESMEEKGSFPATTLTLSEPIEDNDAVFESDIGKIKRIEEFEDEFTFTIELSRKNKKEWAKILMMPRWEETEWIFPKKKKRGTKRRKRWMEQ